MIIQQKKYGVKLGETYKMPEKQEGETIHEVP